MVERIAGLAPDPERPGYRHFYIQPRPGGPLTSAEAELETPYGTARSAWRKTGDRLVIETTVPPNTTATLVVPAAPGRRPRVSESGRPCQLIQERDRLLYKLVPGRYVFEVQ
jgi:alpha-L-rhamnosidase